MFETAGLKSVITEYVHESSDIIIDQNKYRKNLHKISGKHTPKVIK